MRQRMPRKDGLELALRATGSLSKLAEIVGVKVQSVAQWEQVPSWHCLTVEAATGVSRHDLRPDIYGPHPSPRRQRGNGEARAA